MKISRPNLVASAMVLLLAAAGGVLITRDREPRYEGKRASVWAADLASHDEAVRARAAEALRSMGSPAAPYFGHAMTEKDSFFAGFARWTFRFVPRIVSDKIRPFLHESSPRGKTIRAARALEMMGSNAANAIPELERGLRNPDAVISSSAGLALARIGTPAVPALVRALTDPVSHVRASALLALGQAGPAAAGGAADLAAFLERNANNSEGLQASASLAQIGERAVPQLVRILATDDSRKKFLAAQTLQLIGPGATAAVPPLIQELENGDVVLRRESARALAAIQPFREPSTAALLKALGDPDAQVRANAAEGLQGCPRAVRQSLGTFRKLLSDPDMRVRSAAAYNIGQIGEGGVPALGDLEELASSSGDGDGLAARQAIKTIHDSAALTKK